ncbi:MAG: VOC family protein, partial [Actinobacteria bacterium]|nr:VOC family protein [Actinomycetota bacterium]
MTNVLISAPAATANPISASWPPPIIRSPKLTARTDPAAAKQFYHGLLGWSYEDNDMGDGMIYTQASANGVPFGGIMQSMAPEGVPPHWIPYISTDNVDEGLKQIASLGGQVLFGPNDIPGGIGRFALVSDPQGAVFQYFKPGMEGGGE